MGALIVRRCMWLLVAAAVWLPGAATAVADGGRLALVIGNAAYRQAPLKNPVNDARAVASALRGLGFDVIMRENADLGEMLEAIRQFSILARRNQVRLLYYAGHGAQVEGRNYLIPVDEKISGDDDIARKSADMSELVSQLGELQEGTNILILDACRNNPYKAAAFKTDDGRVIRLRGGLRSAVNNGLARVQAPNGTVVAFSTAPGSIAMDGQNYANSLYTKHLLDHIGTPGLPVEQLFKRVRIAVARDSRRMQIPWESSSLMGEFCFRPGNGGACNVGGGIGLGVTPR
ncbi:MAG: caspase family protein [Rhodocyclaceae bacterium]|nr:caspase family protein [Rhodocyclaceae bacterium]